MCVWRDLSHPLDNPASARRRLRRMSSVVDRPAEAGRYRRAGGTIPPEVCAEQRQRLRTTRPEWCAHLLRGRRCRAGRAGAQRNRAHNRGRIHRIGALPRGPSPRPLRAGLRQDGSRKEHTMSHTPHDFLAEARRAIPEVSVEDVAARRTRGDELILLDVREKDEVRAGYIEGAVTIPRGFLEFQAAGQLPQTDVDVVVYCASGARSLLAAQVLRTMGYTRVASMAGGITRWQEAGYPVVRDRQLSAEQLERYSRHFLL